MQQNQIPIVRYLLLQNISDETVSDLRVVITADPETLTPWSVNVALLHPQETVELTGIDLRFSTSYLFALTERINGSLTVAVFSGDDLLYSQAHELAFLSFNEWSGGLAVPEIMAAFVTPNHPYVTEIVRQASVILHSWQGNPSFTGYQSKSLSTVRLQAAAIYGALQSEGITYCVAPASFELVGQKVRLADAVQTTKMGNCLDLSLLYAACLEHIGLNPMIVLVQGHAFVAFWQEEESFAECVQDDLSVLTKRIAEGINEICVVEATAVVVGGSTEFESAVTAAARHLADPGRFVYLVDIKRARGSGIRPLPQTISGEGDSLSEAHFKTELTSRPAEVSAYSFTENAKTDLSRQQLWERKLLDLSMRNTLLNFRVTKNSMQLLLASAPEFVQRLTSGEEFQIQPRPADLKNSPRDDKLFEMTHQEHILDKVAQSEFQQGRIRTFLSEVETGSTIASIYRTAKTSMEENGANTLFIALGFLRWYEGDRSEKPRLAPLILIPVDLVRRSAQRGYVIRARDEEAQVNITLLEMLRQDFGLVINGLEQFSNSDAGVDANMVFSIVRRAIMSRPRWDVEELAVMGIFSFSRFIMYHDLKQRMATLTHNKVVASLVAGRLTWDATVEFPTPEQLDMDLSPSDIATPIATDSSQLSAIVTAGKGKSYVLHGPPGTGKSQTITNIIANALYQGKSVLFVAEKMAALSVVQSRLAAIGLGPFCLELHSNKARKRDILSQLEQTLEFGRTKHPDEYRATAEAINSSRRELNQVISEIHRPRLCGFSLYDSLAIAEQQADYLDLLIFPRQQLLTLTKEQLSKQIDHCQMLLVASKACGGVADHPLAEIDNEQFSSQLEHSLRLNLSEYHTVLESLATHSATVYAELGIDAAHGREQLAALAELSALLLREGSSATELLLHNDLPQHRVALQECFAKGRRCDELAAELRERYRDAIFDSEAASAELKWNMATQSWFVPRFFQQNAVLKLFRARSLQPNSLQKGDIPELLKKLSEYHLLQREITDKTEFLRSFFPQTGSSWDWERLELLYDANSKAFQLVQSMAANRDQAAQALSMLHSSCSTILQQQEKPLRELPLLDARIHELELTLSADFSREFAAWHNESDWLILMEKKATRWMSNLKQLRDYCGYVRVKKPAVLDGLAPVIDALERGSICHDELLPTFSRNIHKQLAEVTIDSSTSLREFSGAIFTERISRFKQLNDEFVRLTIQELVAKLSAGIPLTGSNVSISSEIGILQRAIRSGGRGTSIRKLFESIPTLLRRMSPCMLMSPISVAQYIDPTYPPFDIIVFDEASQVPTCEAIGAIARGQELIVVGDPKQLPPTSFFSSTSVDEDNYDKEDLESILDDCLALSMPQQHLLWHYRSRHESLIAFSNRNYYDNRLRTFPSPNNLISKVSLVQLEGYYDRGRSKRNEAEARAIVAEIAHRLRAANNQSRSLGVVTFSSVQQNYILDLLDEQFRNDPELDALAHDAPEPLFVKNLENVQGDERDVILFSIGYGPDASGKVNLNFGPLNREGGWRRLNVAVSRAREEMIVFATMRPEEIDLSRTLSKGVAELKSFLEFAARGSSNPTGSKTGNTDDMAHLIAERLRAKGYRVDSNVGSSSYKVDLAIVSQFNDEEYILGIILDSPGYFNSGNLQDRVINQEAALRRLGWRVHKLWIMDYWYNAEREIAKIIEILEQIPPKSETAKTLDVKPELQQEHVAPLTFEQLTADALSTSLPKYTFAALTTAPQGADFLAVTSFKLITQQIADIVATEAPLSHNYLYRSVLDIWGLRAGQRIARRFEEVLRGLRLRSTKSGDRTFYWRADQQPEEFDSFRTPPDTEKSRRSLDDIAPEEIAAAVRHTLTWQISLSTADLEREVVRLFGYSRCTEAMRAPVSRGIALAVSRGYAVVNGDRVSCASEP